MSDKVSGKLLVLSMELTDFAYVVGRTKMVDIEADAGGARELLGLLDSEVERLVETVKLVRVELGTEVVVGEDLKIVVMDRLEEQLGDIAMEWVRKSGKCGGFERFKRWKENDVRSSTWKYIFVFEDMLTNEVE